MAYSMREEGKNFQGRGGEKKTNGKKKKWSKILKTVPSNRRKIERSVMYNIVYTLQLGLHLESRTSPKEVTF